MAGEAGLPTSWTVPSQQDSTGRLQAFRHQFNHDHKHKPGIHD